MPDPQAKPDAAAMPEAKTEPRSATPADAGPEAGSLPDLTPQLVKRVHELYEQLGREEVRAVEDWEKAQQQVRPGQKEATPRKRPDPKGASE